MVNHHHQSQEYNGYPKPFTKVAVLHARICPSLDNGSPFPTTQPHGMHHHGMVWDHLSIHLSSPLYWTPWYLLGPKFKTSPSSYHLNGTLIGAIEDLNPVCEHHMEDICFHVPTQQD